MISLVIRLGIIGFLTWVIVTYVPMPEPFKKGIIVVVLILVLLYVLRLLGVADIPLR